MNVKLITGGERPMNYGIGDCRAVLRSLAPEQFQTCITSPPYWGLRDYGHPDQIGLEPTPAEYVAHIVEVFREVRRVLRTDGTLWLNLGDCYAGARGGPQGQSGEMADRSAAKVRVGAVPGSGGQCGGTRNRDGVGVVGGLKPKDLVGIPWRVAFALQDDGWWLRQDIIWHKPNPMPESVTDRCTKAHEYLFLLSPSEHYFYDKDAIAEERVSTGDRYVGARLDDGRMSFRSDGGRSGSAKTFEQTGEHPSVGREGIRNARSVWTIATQPYSGAHFATMPPELAQRCILAGSRIGDAVLDPFLGSGTVGMVAERNGRKWFGCELQGDYETLIKERTAQMGLLGGAA